MRIIGGRARGRRLRPPPGPDVRPTADRVREALFDIVGQDLGGLSVLDVCAGSGAVALEALSRGAVAAVAVERNAARCAHIRSEAERVGLAGGLEVVRGDALEALGRLRARGARFDLAFVDPPWGEERLRGEVLARLFEAPALCRLAAVECPAGAGEVSGEEVEVPRGARLLRRERYGRTCLAFFGEAEGDEEAAPPGAGRRR